MGESFKKELQLAVKLARLAGKLQLKHLGKIKKIEYKGKIDIVTEVDKACEDLILAGIQKEFPQHDVLAEESGSKKQNSDYRWIVDPLDGTVNFAHGYPMFCVSIALEVDGELKLGVIYDPNRDELFEAELGKGARLNGKKIKVSENEPLIRALLATGFAYNVQDKNVRDNIDHFTHFIKHSQAVRRPGAAAIDLAWLACGRLDGFWELFLKPWDTAAGALLVREAGGVVSSFDGSRFDVYGDEVLASNGKIHVQMIRVLQKGSL